MGQRPMVFIVASHCHRIESFLVLLMMAHTDPAGMSSSAAILRPDNRFRLSFATDLTRRSRVRRRPSLTPAAAKSPLILSSDELLINSLKTAFVWERRHS
jgi:hypothetical protein